jgi:3-oxoadipate enol-lactonase
MNINLDDFHMAYTDAGQGVPLLFIHGYPLSRQLWQPQVDGLADVARILAPDLRGHGDSSATPPPYSMELFADDLNAFLDAIGITQPVVICGLSMGGYVAFAFYRKYAQRMAGLILTATRAAADSLAARAARDQSAADARQKGVESIAEGMLPRLLSPRAFQEKPNLVTGLRKIMLSVSLEGVLGDLAGMKERPDSTPLLEGIRLPTLLLPGADDQIIPLQEAEAMRAAIPGARLQVIPNTGHLPNLENPVAFNQAVREFLKEISWRTP